MIRRWLLATFLFLASVISVADARSIHGSTNTSFTPQWAQFGLGAGGQTTAFYDYSATRKLVRTDTYGFYVYETVTNCVYGATVYSPPCWRQGFTASNVPGFNIDLANGGGGGVEAVSCPSNLNVIYAFWQGFLYVSQDNAVSWLKTTLTTTQTANDGNASGPFAACDPNDANTAIFDTVTNGVYYTTNGLAGTPTFTNIAALGTGVRHTMVFEQGSSSNVMVSRLGTGVYRSTTGVSGTFSLTTSSPASPNHLYADKFGQVWATNLGNNAYRYASGSWNTHASGAICYGLAFDPTSSSVGTQRVVCFPATGQPNISDDNGGTWTGQFFNQTFSAPAGQPTWLNVANQESGTSAVQLNGYSGAFDSAGNLRFAGGLGVWKTSAPIVANGTAWVADTLGIEQLVVNKIVSPAGGPPMAALWDKGLMRNPNPLAFPSTYYNNNTSLQAIIFAWSLDYASNDPTFMASFGSIYTKTANQGSTFTDMTGLPSSTSGPGGGDIATLTNQKFIVVSNVGQPIYVTSNGGTSFATSTISGTPTNWQGNPGVGWPLAADRLAADTYCAVTTGKVVYYSINAGTNFTASGITGSTLDGTSNLSFFRSIPNKSEYLYSAGGQPGTHPVNTHLWKLTKSTNPCDTAMSVNANVKEVLGFGFGPIMSGQTYPVIYFYGYYNGTLGFYQTLDGFATNPTAVNIPASETPYPLNSMDLVTWLEADPDIYGRFMVGFRGSGAAYIDTQDACPWVSFSNVVANQSLSGSAVSVTAIHSGKVPATGANLYVNGVQVDTTKTGSTSNGTTTYTFTLNATANAGSKTLKIESLGNGCTAGGVGNSKSIPVTLS